MKLIRFPTFIIWFIKFRWSRRKERKHPNWKSMLIMQWFKHCIYLWVLLQTEIASWFHISMLGMWVRYHLAWPNCAVFECLQNKTWNIYLINLLRLLGYCCSQYSLFNVYMLLQLFSFNPLITLFYISIYSSNIWVISVQAMEHISSCSPFLKCCFTQFVFIKSIFQTCWMTPFYMVFSSIFDFKCVYYFTIFFLEFSRRQSKYK